MRVYIAGRYGRRRELAGYADELRADGHEVTSRWLDGSEELDRADAAGECSGDVLREAAIRNFEDVGSADAVVCFTETPDSGHGRGGRHVELGMALAWQKRLMIVGPRENVFCHLLNVIEFPDWPNAMVFLHRWAGIRWVESPHERLQRVEEARCLID